MGFNAAGYEIFEELRFIIELVLAEMLFAIPCYKRKKNFPARAAIGFALLIGWAFLYFPIRSTFSSGFFDNARYMVIVIIMLHYSILTVLTTVYLYFCFEYRFSQALLNTVCGYCVQHLCYVIFTELLARTWVTAIIDYMPVYALASITGFIIVCLLAYFFIVRKFRTIEQIHVGKERSTAISFALILITTILLTFSGQSIYQNEAQTRIVTNPNYLGAVVSVFTCALVMLVVYLLYFENQKEREKSLVSSLLYEQTKQYEFKKDEIETLKRFVHDAKHQILELRASGGASPEKINEAMGQFAGIDFFVDTGNEAVNIILVDKNLAKRNEGISIEFDGDASLLSFMDPHDIYVFLGNALDNAMEAIAKSAVEEKKILFSIKSSKGVVSVQVSNYFDGNVEIKDGKVQTSKTDKAFHGIGLSSIRKITEKYGGMLEIDAKGNVFTLKAIFVRNER